MKKEKLNKLHLNSITITKIGLTKTAVIKAGFATNDSGLFSQCECFGAWTICGLC